MKKPFVPALVTSSARVDSGSSDTPTVRTVKIADEVFGGVVPGPWLACYMLRRFGWPNEGGDDHKDLCRWLLSTPVEGLCLSVSPYLGGGMNLHFALRFTSEVRAKLLADPGRDRFVARKAVAVQCWWKQTGSKLYTWGCGQKEGDEDTLAHLYAEHPQKPGHVFGLWKRTAKHGRMGRNLPPMGGMMNWWLGEFIRKSHPEVKLPKMTASERAMRATPFQRKAEAAIRTTLASLLNPTSIRDLRFSPFGDIDRAPEATKRSAKLEHVEPFADAGNTPEYLYTTLARKRRQKKAA